MERGHVRETLDQYWIDFEARGLREIKEEIDAFLASDVSDDIKDSAFMVRFEDRDGFPEWRLVYDRPETNEEWAVRVERELEQMALHVQDIADRFTLGCTPSRTLNDLLAIAGGDDTRTTEIMARLREFVKTITP